MQPRRHTTHIEPDERAPGRGRGFVTRVLGDHPEVAADASLIVSELLTNAVVHNDPSEPITLEVGVEKERVRLLVSTEPGTQVQLKLRRPDAPGGFGLSIVNALASEWGIKRSPRPSVWCDLSLPGASC